MSENNLVSKQHLEVKHLRYNKETRLLEITGTRGERHKLPVETTFKRRIIPGSYIRVEAYTRHHFTNYKVFQGETDMELAHYGPAEKEKRDAHYGQEVSRKVSGL